MWKYIRKEVLKILREEADGLLLDHEERLDSLDRDVRDLRLEVGNIKSLLEILNPPPRPPEL